VANEEVVRRALLGSSRRILDLAAGTGRTAEAALPLISKSGRIVCLEPSAAMRAEGERRLDDSRITWTAEYPQGTGVFDRILCGAAIWQLLPLNDTFRKLAALLAPGGALCFNIPSLYLGEADEAGGGRDPLLLELPSLLSRSPIAAAPPPEPFPSAEQLEKLLEEAGLKPEHWSFRVRVTQEAYRDWLKIPVLTNNLLVGIDPDERARAIDLAFTRVDPHSWRWEHWAGWTAWKSKPSL